MEHFVDLKFVLSGMDMNHSYLKKGCLFNHNRGEGHLTCKTGLTESLHKNVPWTGSWYPMEKSDPEGFGVDNFFPRSHLVGSAEALQDF